VVATITGIPQSVFAFSLEFKTLFRGADGCPTAPDAWNLAVCPGAGIAVRFAETGVTCPLVGTSNRRSGYAETPDGLLAITQFDPVVPAPDTTYTIMVVDFDHATSVAGPTHDGLCGGADLPGCVTVAGTMFYTNGTQVALEALPLFWQSADGCSFCDATLPTTWGQVRARYR
jgi:hypothetical protein